MLAKAALTRQTSQSTPKSHHPLLVLLPHRENTLGNPFASPWRQVTGFIEVHCDLMVCPSLRPQRQHGGNQFLLVSTQRSNVEGDRTAANDERHCGFSGGNLRSRSHQGHSTVTLFAKFRGLSTSVPRAQAVWYASNCSGTTCSMGLSAP